MLKHKITAVLFFLLASLALSTSVGHCREGADKMLIRVDISDHTMAEKLAHIGYGLDVAAYRSGEYADIVIDPGQLWRIAGAGLVYKVLMNSPRDVAPYSGKAAYHTYDGIRTELKQIAADHPSITRLDTLTIAAQGGKVWCLKISDNPAVSDNSRHGILIMGNHHAREWMTPEICLYIANYLTNNYNPAGTDSLSNLIKTREIYIAPLVNPDGFVYDNGGNYGTGVMWRKNRRQNSPTVYGVDLNRGYDGSVDGDIRGSWGSAINSYTSPDSSNDVFYGFSPSGEPEQQAMMKLVKEHNIVLSISYHTYSELVLWPLGYVDSTVKRAPDSLELRYFGQQSAARIKKYRSTLGYTPQQSSALYPTTGDSDGWIYGYGLTQLGRVIFPYCVEADTAFYTPPDHIDSICPQTLKGFMYLAMRTDSLVSTTSPPPVLPPVIDPVYFPTKGKDTNIMWLTWKLLNPPSNPTAYEVQEMTGFTATTDTVGAAANPNVSLNGFASSTVRMYSGSRSYYSAVSNQFNIASITTNNPYPVSSARDSFSFYSYQAMTGFDRIWVEISTDARQWDLLGKIYGNVLSWTRRAFAIDSAKYYNKSVFFRIRLVGDGMTATDGIYIDDIKPVAAYSTAVSLSNSITIPSYVVGQRIVGETYYYRVRGYNAKRSWGDWSQLKIVLVDPSAVELSSFTALQVKDKVEVRWRTESEHDCDFWLIERSTAEDGNFAEVGKVAGHLSSNEPHQYVYTDASDLQTGIYYYRLAEVDLSGTKTYYGPMLVEYGGRDLPLSYRLEKAYPNPFGQNTNIKYQILKSEQVSLKIYNIAGQVIRVLVDGNQPAGYYTAVWDGRDAGGRQAANGVYLYQMTSGDFSATGKVMIIR
ncbi:MAG: M14 family zinc carboxypeptidase [Candidatus Edwardsbacteria bacterium]|nr:M14 family zinc carboxypeptidase [Candidatus Edwardsbacteria bacterium]